MGSSVEWRDKKYEEVFEEELRFLQRRRKFDPSCTVMEIERVLKSLYIMDGADWYGRGYVQDITLSATIAAYEYFVGEWKTRGLTPEEH